MGIFEKRIDEILLADVEELVKGRYPEGPNLEYKSAFHETKWPDEFMDTVAALANGGGGLLLYGVTEEHDYPTGVPGCKLPNSVRLTMQQKSNDLRPHVPVGVQVIPVPGSGGKTDVVVVEVPKGLDLVSSKGKFYFRGAAGNDLADTIRLRQYFRAEMTTTGVDNRFWTAAEVIATLMKHEPPLPLAKGECRITFRVHPFYPAEIVRPTPEDKKRLHAAFEKRGIDVWERQIVFNRDRVVLTRESAGPRHDTYITRLGSVRASALHRLPKIWEGSGFHPIALSDLKTDMAKFYLAAGDVLIHAGYTAEVAVSVLINPVESKIFLLAYMNELDEGPMDIQHLGAEGENIAIGRWKTSEPVFVAQMVRAAELVDDRIDRLIDAMVDEICLDFAYAGETDLTGSQRTKRQPATSRK